MNKIVMKLLGLALVAGSLSACSSGSGSTVVVSGGTGNTDPYYHAWYDVYGNYCGTGYPTAGCNFFSDGYKITMKEDPYYRSNIFLTYDYWTYTDSYGYRQSYQGYAWLSSTGVLYDEYGDALNEMDQDATQSADVISQAAAKEAKVTAAVGKALAQKYALNEDKGIMISQALQDWAKLGKGRARTVADAEDFSKRIYGVEASKGKNAIVQALASQSQAPLEELNVDVAAYWGTSPEVSKKILKSWYKQEVNTYGIK